MYLRTTAAAAIALAALLMAAPSVRSDDGVKMDTYAGWEFDLDGQGYAYLGTGGEFRVSEPLALRIQASGSYSYYRFDSAGRHLRARAPGAAAMAGFRYYLREDSWVGVLAGAEYTNTVVKPADARHLASVQGSDVGFIVEPGFDIWTATHTNFSGLARYSHATEFYWGRLRLKQQVYNNDYSGPVNVNLGVEGSGAGNDDYEQYEVGPLVEFYIIPAKLSFLLHGGYKHSSSFSDGAYAGVELSIGY